MVGLAAVTGAVVAGVAAAVVACPSDGTNVAVDVDDVVVAVTGVSSIAEVRTCRSTIKAALRSGVLDETEPCASDASRNRPDP